MAAGSTQTIGFTGHVNDIETGLTYMQQRYYDPVAGGFLSIDPVTTDAGTGSSFNRYAYANNSPYRYIDPDGRSPAAVFMALAQPMALGAAIGGGIDAVVQYSTKGEVDWGPKGVLGAAAEGATFGLMGRMSTPSSAAPQAAVVTQASIQAALKGSPMTTAQSAVSLPAVAAYVKKIEAGMVAPAIKVDGKIIVDGNHRYVAGRVAGKEPAQTAGTASPSQASQAKPIEKIKVDSADWGNR